MSALKKVRTEARRGAQATGGIGRGRRRGGGRAGLPVRRLRTSGGGSGRVPVPRGRTVGDGQRGEGAPAAPSIVVSSPVPGASRRRAGPGAVPPWRAGVSPRYSPGRTAVRRGARCPSGAAAGRHPPCVRPGWPEGAAGTGMLLAEPQCRGDLNFGSAWFWGCPARRGRGAGAGGASPPAPLPPFPAGRRAAPGTGRVRRRGRAAPPGFSRCSGGTARPPGPAGRQLGRRGGAGGRWVPHGPGAGSAPARVRSARRGGRVRGGGCRALPLPLRCPRWPGPSRVALAAHRAAFAGGLKHRLPEK